VQLDGHFAFLPVDSIIAVILTPFRPFGKAADLTPVFCKTERKPNPAKSDRSHVRTHVAGIEGSNIDIFFKGIWR
jgi:hypothetical protein